MKLPSGATDTQILGHTVAEPDNEHRAGRALLLRRRGLPDGGGGHGGPGHHHLHAGGAAQGVQANRPAAQVPAQMHLHLQGQEGIAHR